MRVLVEQDYAALSRVAADIVAKSIREAPDSAVVVATGNTPVGTYRELAARKERGEIDTSHLRVFQLDEYVGSIGKGTRDSLYGWMEREFLTPLGVPEKNVVRLPYDAPELACRRYDEAISSAGGFDLALLGLGPNGHLGFNEPPADPRSPSRVVSLSTESLESNARYWSSGVHVPHAAMTAGMASLLGTRHILLLVSGASKQSILRRTLQGPVTEDVPASLLRTAREVTVIADEKALPTADHDDQGFGSYEDLAKP